MTFKKTRKVLHKQVYRKGTFGGIKNTTLCGRVRNGNDYNVADTDAEVTCKFCLKRMQKAGSRVEVRN